MHIFYEATDIHPVRKIWAPARDQIYIKFDSNQYDTEIKRLLQIAPAHLAYHLDKDCLSLTLSKETIFNNLLKMVLNILEKKDDCFKHTHSISQILDFANAYADMDNECDKISNYSLKLDIIASTKVEKITYDDQGLIYFHLTGSAKKIISNEMKSYIFNGLNFHDTKTISFAINKNGQDFICFISALNILDPVFSRIISSDNGIKFLASAVNQFRYSHYHNIGDDEVDYNLDLVSHGFEACELYQRLVFLSQEFNITLQNSAKKFYHGKYKIHLNAKLIALLKWLNENISLTYNKNIKERKLCNLILRFNGNIDTHHALKKVGAIIERPNFYPYMSAFQNLQLVCKIKEVFGLF